MEGERGRAILDFLSDVAADRTKLERFLDRDQREALLNEYTSLTDNQRRWLLEDNVDELRNAAQGEREAELDAAAAPGAGEFWLSSPLKRPIN
ncbi:MAG TPA: hypothetical protein VLB86_06445 [Gaiellaceae bacterium]|nr:hypothetical protein [Gaiellaceae bacterium]